MNIDLIYISVSVLIVFVLGLLSFLKGILDVSGFFTALVTGLIVAIFGGFDWVIILTSFLIFASLFTKYKYEQKELLNVAEEKKGARSWNNVLANGLLVIFSVIVYGLNASPALKAVFLGAVSTVTADTLATEIGLLNHGPPRLITNMRQHVKRGVSGGISLLGELAALFGAFLIALVSWLVNFTSPSIWPSLVIILVSGFFGSNMDSFLGATIQASYTCGVCQNITEKKIHCLRPAELQKGITWVDNDMVNLISTLFGGLMALIIFSFIGI